MGMNNPLEAAAMPVKKDLRLFYAVDTSGSMYGEKINSVNVAIRESIPELQKISSGPDADIKVAALKFADSAEWLCAPTDVENFNLSNMIADGWTAFGDALVELNKKLSREEYLKTDRALACPVILLISDGEPTQTNPPWEDSLRELEKNKYFKAAIKIALAVGKDANIDILAKFTKNKEAVFMIHNNYDLKKLIKIVSFTSMMYGSKSSNTAASGADVNDTANKTIVDAAAAAANDAGINVHDYGGDDNF